ncbi:peptidoglycan D,D-transpeptidase FtsI family protein [Caldanaerovirga acetigignens]|uniref:peptidoglycan D,D-transpeptidase FtsI family protein n=1 Tax=Caldanaerovirga acetigignens TaxID=447595 RepID=UPI001FCA6B80|nr:penicillin-binding protein 2 [Caldanaerovirga acetigignens]
MGEITRGGIFDRNGESLLGSYEEKCVFISPKWLKDTEIEFLQKNNVLTKASSNEPKSIKLSDINLEITKRLIGKTPGIFLYSKKMRYGSSALATHLVGYSGKAGIEKAFNQILEGDKKANILFDGLGQPIPGISKDVSEDESWGIYLTIDSRIQSIVERIMDQSVKKGAVIVIDAKTGEILAMASRPNYKQFELEKYIKDEDSPLINRAVQAYIPGSIFKIVVLSAALEENIATLNDEFFCNGSAKVGGNVIRCSSYEKGGHGRITLKEAFAHSCNSVFIELGIRLGKERILKYAEKFGLGKTVLDILPEEKPGYIPSYKNVYYADLGNLSIGQGNLQITPLQAAQIMLIIANDGLRKTPLLVKKVVDKNGHVNQMEFKEKEAERIISSDTARKVREALEAVVDYGSGLFAAPSEDDFRAAGKTGTAELGDGTNHAWFVGYFPADNPRYIIAVFIEKGQSGPLKAAPVFRKIAEEIYFFERKVNMHFFSP